MDKEPSIINKINQNEAERKEIERDFSVKTLAGFLKENKLTMDIVKQEAEKLNVKIHELGYEILIEAGLEDEYFEYSQKIGKYSSDNQLDILSGFFEKIQQKPEIIPAEIEQKPEDQLVEALSEVQEPEREPAPEPTTPPAQKPQPATTASQEPEISSPEPISPAKIAVQPPENLPIAETTEIIPNPGRRNWQEVKRETEVMAIEDLDGSMNKFKEHVEKLGVAKEDADGEWHWTGGNKKLVFLGDILGDRAMDGMKITSIVRDLAEQAEKQHGQADHLCGNHDMDFLRFLCSPGGRVDDEKDVRILTDQYRGIWELAYFDPDPDSELKKTNPFSADFGSHAKELWNKLFEKMPKILEATRNDPLGRYFLKNLCQIKVAVVYDDTLYCHTDPTSAMVSDLTKDGNIPQRVAAVNKVFQDNLRKAIFENIEFDDDFRHIKNVYLNANNREYFTDQISAIGLAEDLLYRRVSAKMGRAERERNIEEWKKEYEIVGNFFDEVNKILDGDRTKNKDQKKSKEKLEDELIEKIERLNPMGRDIEKIKNSGINAIIHGHSPRRDNKAYNENNFIIVSPHAHFDDGINDDKGISVIRKNGRIDLIGKAFRK
jgi:hypothetical protein